MRRPKGCIFWSRVTRKTKFDHYLAQFKKFNKVIENKVAWVFQLDVVENNICSRSGFPVMTYRVEAVLQLNSSNIS